VESRIGLYSGGVAQLRREEPEPSILRWPDIETVTIELNGRGHARDRVGELRPARSRRNRDNRQEESSGLSGAVHRTLGPRLVPPLIEAYDRGEPVTAGGARIDREGFTMRPGKRLTWSEIKSVTMQHAPKGSADVATRIDIRVVRRNRLHYFDPSGIPNAIFFAHALARAAMRNGVQVDGYQGT
jgi:hypothetical protein